ncbi:site-specific integrase [Pseudothauera rhizosphaerae]|uniref:Site-specific integrase n=1 Tax=Pseudothauera rhizosphaerae TaxID=2565932 RepID=A0A4S4ALF1_9RHOO|nr:site-specific integrase [Pseudothauera rhizosphaerae]THF60347.1 site-specific integrase [Pseudothauera rhizosphaerae]
MHSDSTRLSIVILRAVLAGMTYDAVATTHGRTRTEIERRVKYLAKMLQRQIGIEGLNPEAAGYVRTLRTHRRAVETALGCFEMGDTRLTRAPPRNLTDQDVHTVIHRAGLHSPAPLRDMALIHIVLATGARPLEVARFEISDYLNPDGTVRANSEIRASVSVNRKARPLFFRSSAAVRAIDAYLAQRMKRCGRHPGADAPYRGFEPSERLFLNDASEPYTVHCLDVDGRPRFLCRQMLDTYRKIFKRINLRGLSALILRRTVAVRLDARGADVGQIGLILGIAEKQAVRQLLPRRPDIAELMTDLYSDFDSPAAALPGPDSRGRTSGNS